MLATAIALLLAAAPSCDDQKQAMETHRGQLAARFRAAKNEKQRLAVLQEARTELLANLDTHFFPAWAGTPWAYGGTSETPNEGHIACGYYVTTLLRDSGFRVERVTLAQQASEKIVKTLSPASDVQRFRDADLQAVVDAVRKRHGEGLYVVGMDFHVGLLRIDATKAQLCHSAVLGEAKAVCEDAVTSPGMVSRYHVIGPVFSDERIKDWLSGRAIITVRE